MSIAKLLQAANTTNKLLIRVNYTLCITNIINALTIVCIAVLLYIQVK